VDKKYNILIVDDHDTCRILPDLFLKNLYRDKVNVISAESGIKALDLVDKAILNGGIDLILMDLKMPQMNGLEVREEILKIYEKNKLNAPIIIAYTADAIQGSESKYKQQGFDEYLSKPLTKQQLNETISKYLN
jgi:CheY-like chemotaxis protein